MPTTDPLVQDIIDKNTARLATVIDGISPTDWVAATKKACIYQGLVYRRDDADTTSPTALPVLFRSYDNVCFRSDSVKAPERGFCSVEDFLNDPPATVAAGEVYGVGPAPTGAFASYANQIATALAGSPSPIYEFMAPPWPGYFVYSRALEIYRSWTGAAWQDGLNATYALASIAPETMAVRNYVVQDVLATPPGSPGDGLYWLIAASGATGAFAGHEGKVIKRVAGAWATPFTPNNGDAAFVIGGSYAGRVLRRIAGVWSDSDKPHYVYVPARVVLSGSTAVPAGYTPSWGTAPTTTNGVELFAVTRTLVKTANRIELFGEIDVTNLQATPFTLALHIDGAATAAYWKNYRKSATNGTGDGTDGGDLSTFSFNFEHAVGDLSSHIYRIRALALAGGTVNRAWVQPREIET